MQEEKSKKSIPEELCSRFGEVKVRQQIMAEYGHSNASFIGKNVDGETIEMYVYTDHLTLKTYQNNGWIRVDYFCSDGSKEIESYDGKWK